MLEDNNQNHIQFSIYYHIWQHFFSTTYNAKKTYSMI